MDRHLKYSKWVHRLNTLDYSRATRSFYAALRSKNKSIEYYGSIRTETGSLCTTLHDCLDAWADYYERLYKNVSTQRTFDLSTTIGKGPTLDDQQNSSLNADITMADIIHAINSLNDYTTPGSDMIINRDFTILLHMDAGKTANDYPESWTILQFLFQMIVGFWKKGSVPSQVKGTVLRPFLKADDKDPTDPDYYRPIALISVVRKVYGQILKRRLLDALENVKFFSKTQAAYRYGRSTCDHLLALQEIFFHYRYFKASKKVPLYLCFLDFRKAFDTVPRKLLFAKLAALGIKGKIFRAIKDLYTNTNATIRVGNYESRSFEIESGVMQGSKLGPLLFIIFLNDLLIELERLGIGIMIGKVSKSALGFADDIILITDSPSKLQELINYCGKWSKKNDMRFNHSKCKVMTLNLRKSPVMFNLLGKNIDFVTEYKYLGVKFSNKRQTSLVIQHISSILEHAGRRVNCIRHYGFSSDGLRPATSIRMYKILVRPILEYAGQVLSYRHYYYYSNSNDSRNKADLDEHIVKLEAFQNRVLKMLVPCSKSTSPAIVRIFSGCMPIAARIDILKLRYFWKISHSDDGNLAYSILKYTRNELHTKKIGFIHEVFKICQKHNCLDVWLKIKRPKENPLEKIRRIIELNYLTKDHAVCLTSTCVYS